MTSDVGREVARKILHMAMGLFGLVLRWLTPWQGALCALAALAHNLWLFPFYGYGKLLRPEEKARGYSGMLGYPAVVLVLTLLVWTPKDALFALHHPFSWNHAMAVAAGAWAVLAFGDAAAALSGMFLKGPAVPWNPAKRWTGWLGFTLVGGLFASLWVSFVQGAPFGTLGGKAAVGAAFSAALLAGLVESLPGQIDDNLTVPLMAWLVLAFADGPGLAHLSGALTSLASPGVALLLVLNAALGLTSYALRWVGGASCALGILFGSVVALGMGWKGYVLLLLFYVVSQVSTFYGGRVKRARGIAEPDGGRRGVGSVFSKGLVPALFSLLSPLAFAASLAVYAADTVASEFGKASGGTAHLLFRRKPVQAGTVGAVSRVGTLAGLAVMLLFVCAAAWLGGMVDTSLFMPDDVRVFSGFGALAAVGWMDLAIMLFALFVACTAAFFAESLLNERVAAPGWASKEVVHLFTGGLAGSLTLGLAGLLATIVALAT